MNETQKHDWNAVTHKWNDDETIAHKKQQQQQLRIKQTNAFRTNLDNDRQSREAAAAATAI